MNKFLSFLAGVICGAIVGAGTALLLAPESGEELRADVVKRWEDALAEAKQAMEDTRRDLQTQFEQMQKGTFQEPEETG
ncbi:MAG: YtxH domain-containing protein [Candidatus Promineifilaceae bacterium]|jgi:gas vesicle protein